MRFDDSLETVLAADMSNAFGAQSGWRQLVDLIGRGRAPASAEAIARLRAIRPLVPAPIRSASARALAFANPPAALVALFADDDLAIAAPVLRIAELPAERWIEMLASMSSANRSVLRHRRDLAAEVVRALESFGPIDFILPAGVDAPPLSMAPIKAVPEAAEAAFEGAAHAPAPTALVADDIETPGTSQPVRLTPDPLSIDWTEMLPPEPPQLPVDTRPLSIDWTQFLPEPAITAAASPAVAPAGTARSQYRDADSMIDWREVIALRPPNDPPLRAVVAVASQPIADLPVIDDVGPAVVEMRAGMSAEAAEVEIELGVDAEVGADAYAPPSPPAQGWPDSSFVSLASVALGLPVVVEALRLRESVPLLPPEAPAIEMAPEADVGDRSTEAPAGAFQISDLVARIEAFQRRRDGDPQTSRLPASEGAIDAEPDAASTADDFRFETDSHGVIRWVSGVSRSAVIGMTIAPAAQLLAARVDGVVAGAFQHRSSFSDGRLRIDGTSDAAGAWQISGVPAFDPASGRFSGYRGRARRPRIDERAEPSPRGRSPATDALRQLVHELRTPTTAIAGFAEMIETELLGPVASPYRDYASTIRHSASALLGAIDDLDTAARIEAHALDLRPTQVPLLALIERIAVDLTPLVDLRHARLVIEAAHEVEVHGDDRAIDRLFARLLAALVSAAGSGEVITVQVATIDDIAVIDINRPSALAAYPGDALLSIDAEREAEQGAPLLGTGFALRLARNLATELGGNLAIGAERLTLRLPAALSLGVDQASTN